MVVLISHSAKSHWFPFEVRQFLMEILICAFHVESQSTFIFREVALPPNWSITFSRGDPSIWFSITGCTLELYSAKSLCTPPTTWAIMFSFVEILHVVPYIDPHSVSIFSEVALSTIWITTCLHGNLKISPSRFKPILNPYSAKFHCFHLKYYIIQWTSVHTCCSPWWGPRSIQN